MHPAGFTVQQTLLFLWALNRLYRYKLINQAECFSFQVSRQVHAKYFLTWGWAGILGIAKEITTP